MKWRCLKVGDKVKFHVDEFDTVVPHDVDAEVIEVHSHYAIARSGCGMNLWIDDDTADLFRRA